MRSKLDAPISRQRVLLSDFNKALRQQMFFWGRDVMTQNNLLLKFGFQKRASAGLKGTSCYWMPNKQGIIELHGACAGWYPDEASSQSGFLFIRTTGRCYSHHLHTPVIPGHHPFEWLSNNTPEVMQSAQAFAAWLANYEAWIQHKAGADYRNECRHMLGQLPKGSPWLPPKLAGEWLRRFALHGPHTPRAKTLLKDVA